MNLLWWHFHDHIMRLSRGSFLNVTEAFPCHHFISLFNEQSPTFFRLRTPSHLVLTSNVSITVLDLFSHWIVIVESKTLGGGGINYNNWRWGWWLFVYNRCCIYFVLFWILFGVFWNRYSSRSCIFWYIGWSNIGRY